MGKVLRTRFAEDHPCARQNPEIFVFAEHLEHDLREADHRDPNQWRFYVIESARIPWGGSLSTSELHEKMTVCRLSEVPGAVRWTKAMIASVGRAVLPLNPTAPSLRESSESDSA